MTPEETQSALNQREVQLRRAQDELTAMRHDLSVSNQQRDEAQAACAEMRIVLDETLHCPLEHFHNFNSCSCAEQHKHALSSTCGKDLLAELEQLRNELRYMLDLVISNLEVKDDLHVKYAQRLLANSK